MRTGRTDETACRIFRCLSARADIAYSPDIGSRKAEFVAFKHDETILDPKIQRRDDVICVCVVVCILYKLEQEVGLFVVQIAGQSVGRG